MNFAARIPRTPALILGGVWAATAAALSWPDLLANLEFFKKPGPQFYTATVIGLAVAALAVPAYARIRRRSLWRFEPAFLALFAPLVCFLYEPKGTAVAGAYLVGAAAAGRYCKQKLGLETDSPIAEIGLSAALGLGLWTYAQIVLGVLNAYYWQTSLAMLVAAIVVFRNQIPPLWQAIRAALADWRKPDSSDSPLIALCFVFATILLALSLMVSLTPTISIDAITYHNASTLHYAVTHSLQPNLGSSGSIIPQGFEILMTGVYLLAGWPAAQFISPIFFAVTLLILYRLARECGLDRTAAFCGVVTAASPPFLHWACSVVKNDAAVACFQLAALYCFVRGRRFSNANWPLAGAFFLALSVGAKLTAIYAVAPLGLLLLYGLARAKVNRRHMLALAAFVIFAAPFWQVRSYLAKGSLFYPFDTEQAVGSFPPLAGEERPIWVAFPMQPWSVHFEGHRTFESVSDNPSGMFLVFFWPVWLFIKRKRPNAAERICLFFTGLYFLHWGYMGGYVRYGITIFLLLVALTVGRVVAFYRQRGPSARRSIEIAWTYTFLFALVVTMLLEVNAPQLRYLAGRISKVEFQREAVRFFPPLEYLSTVVGPDDLIFSLDNQARGYAPWPANYDYMTPRTRKRTYTMDEIVERMKRKPYRYFIVPTELHEQYRERLESEFPVEFAYGDEHYTVYRRLEM